MAEAIRAPDEEDAVVDLDNGLRSNEDKRCSKCHKINRLKKLIECAQCGSNYHRSCVNINKIQAREIGLYTCAPCRNVITPNRVPSDESNQSSPNFDLLQHLKTCKANLSILGNIPRGARITAAEALNDIINEVINTNSSVSWMRLLCFTFHGLQKPKKEKPTANDPSLVTKIKNQISVFKNSNFPPPEFPFQLRKLNNKPKTEDEILKNRINAKFAENDLRGAIRELSSDDTLTPDNSETLNNLRERHPLAPAEVSLPSAPDNEDAHISVSSESVRLGIHSFPAGSTGGPEGLKPGHLKQMIGASEAGRRLLESLTKLVNLVLKGKIPDDIQPIFFGANLCALSKNDGGVRPIAVGTTLRRLITKVGFKPISQQLGLLFRPNQLGYGSKGGSEAAAHAARHYLTSNIQNKVFLKLDIKNAFNCLNRDIILQKVKEKIPSVFNLLWQAYSKPSHLFYRNNILSSETGIQQGDPCGPALFSLGIDHIVKSLKSELNLWYLDDSNLADSPQIVLEDLQTILRELNNIGLSINSNKCELTCVNLENSESVISDFKEFLPNLKITSIEESIILGSPIAPQGVRLEITSKLNALRRMISRLNSIDPHQAFVLLKNSFAIPKLTYLLRSSKAFQENDILEEIDVTLRNSMSNIVNIEFTDEAWTQASLPVRSGGLGIRKSADISLPCFISSALSATSLVEAILSSVQDMAPFEVATEVEAWKNKGQGLVEPEGESSFSQRA